MKIKRSLRLYLMSVVLISATIMIVAMSLIAVRYFFFGLDVAMSGFMRTHAFQFEMSDNKPVKVNDLTVAKRWKDLPQPIQDSFNPDNMVMNKLEKKIEGIPLFSPPKTSYFAMKMEHDGNVRYASVLVLDHAFSPQEIPHFSYIVCAAIGAIILFTGTLIALIQQVSSPVEALRKWATSLDKGTRIQTIPEFGYSELNSLALIIQSSISRRQESLDNEQQFLGYASHELRTPIAVVRANTELLKKMIAKQLDPLKQLEVVERIERAGYNMTDLTETLLWLNRQDHALPNSQLALGDLVTEIHKELQYLLREKSVVVKCVKDRSTLVAPQGLCRIIIVNLMRNAFQHTYQGEVIVQQKADTLVIMNKNFCERHSDDALGFGLGLELTKRLLDQYGGYYCHHVVAGGWRVEVRFASTS
ncbi:sensor histidine kinase [Vibrio ostreicida]|uniref:sensor histidine kinase n=1 Tax=Vibrio ostreicida TaxID=526588 RepID=UPI00097022F3|nr:HAMP domain-containing sensor histidine kinase [Vibrio ostreicida]